jgi:hypothetical protein
LATPLLADERHSCVGCGVKGVLFQEKGKVKYISAKSTVKTRATIVNGEWHFKEKG